ncbi:MULTISPECIES: hybrid sensor histidine kinase/response regulator transcription factor [Flavobacteriaceae]|uniref:histidine kinase n=2 Tax=Flavobacteriaceae TaxID=49546 RepID=A0A4Y8AQB1_9FLAO|nr:MULTISPECIES: hybrid sensor histidine kinase/response regulator transcription factor [Flavobacteriaceae]TEW72973.1 hybrid sensor histidine kinase/response regulator [Gramella jeungdoensis]GGK48066.1 hybrid sensor histidine kinase/response regulator [Lutibacter litoralis]
MSKLENFIFLLLLFIIQPFTLINGQEIEGVPNNLKFKHFSSKEGLSQSSVVTILQDKKGYLWFGTRDGLNKYDGTKFVTYRHNSADSTSLSHSWITAIFEDTYGNLWIGTKDGLNKYNAKNNNFKQFKHSKSEESISDNEIWDLTQLEDASLWIATNNGLDKLNITTNSFTHFKNSKNNVNSISDNRVRGLLKISDKKLIVITMESIDVLDLETFNIKHLLYPKNVTKESHLNNAPTLFTDSKGEIWLGYSNGLAIYSNKNNQFTDYKIKDKNVITSAVRTICEGFDGELWIGTYTGLYILNTKNNKLRHFQHNDNDPKSLSQNSIYKIVKDSRGDIWIGTWAGGINFYDKSYDNFKLLSAGVNNRMLNYKVISSIVDYGDNELWIGTEGGGLNVYNKKTGKFKYYKHNPNNIKSISSNNIKSIIKDHNNNFWIGTHDGGLNFLETSTKPFKFKHSLNNKTFEEVKDYRIIALFEDDNNNIWLGTSTKGLIKYNTSTKVFTKLDSDLKSVSTIIKSKTPNKILVGGSTGLEKIDVNTYKKTAINYNPSVNKNNIDRAVNCVLEIDSNYWIGTEGQGLYFYDTETNKTTKYGIAEGLPNEVIYGILPDENNNIWISTNYGISRFDLHLKTFKNFDESDGLQGNEFNYGSFLKTKNGILMFGGANGLNFFNPNTIIENNFIPSVDIYAINVSNKPFLNITDSINKIELKYNQNDFSLNFTALSFSQPNKNNYAYKLIGFDTEWNYIGNNKSATYTNLDKGDYTFQVKASNNNGLWNEKGDSINISILPAPWRTWWAYLIYLFIFSIMFYYARKFAITRINEKNELKREKLDKERLAAVNKLKLQLFTNISHDFRTPLTLIIGPVEQLLKQKGSNTFVKRNLETIQRNTNILLQLINELLDFRKSDDGKLKLYASESNIIPFIENIKLSFEELAIQKNINYKLTVSNPVIEVWFDKIKIKKVLLNLLSNAFKFTDANNNLFINVLKETFENKEFLKIEIINFGQIISDEHIDFIFDRFYQLNQKGVQTGTGIGLSLAKSLVELHKGKIEVTSSIENGTCFSVFIPLGKNHLNSEQCVNEVEEDTTNEVFDKPIFVQKELAKAKEIEHKTTKLNENASTLLIVEDNQEVRDFIINIFNSKYNVKDASNGEEGVLIAKKNPVDLIISDVMMPVMDGFQLCKTIKTDILTSHIPIILLTAKTSPIHRKEGYKYGADAYITKPFDATILEVRVDNLLNSRKNLISKFKKDIILKPKELTITSADELFLKKAIEIVENNVSDIDFNVNVFTEQMNMSRSVLYRKFKAITDQSISEFVRTIKLKRAGQLLSQTDLNVSEIAYEVGFNDLKYFRKVFKKQFDELPSNYRKNYSKKG